MWISVWIKFEFYLSCGFVYDDFYMSLVLWDGKWVGNEWDKLFDLFEVV